MMKLCAVVARIWALGVLMALPCSAAAQQAYPSKPIRFIIPYGLGGGADLVARLISQKLTESWGQQVVVENRPGGNTVIGTEVGAKSSPDGYTILEVTNDLVINSLLLHKLPYDIVKDFTPVATLVSAEYLLVVHPSIPANNLQEFIALAKSKPGQLNFATSGSGGVSHIAGEAFNIMAGAKMQHVPYKGSAQALTDLIGGQVQLSVQTPAAAIPYVNSGRLKAIAISGQTRMSALPQVPTFAEGGLPGFDVKAWYGVIAPAGTPKNIISKLSTEIARLLTIPDIRQKLAGQGQDAFISTPDQFAALISTDLAKYARIIKAANIKLEQ